VRITQGGARLVVLDEPTAGLDATPRRRAGHRPSVRRRGAGRVAPPGRPEAADRVVRLDLPAGVPS
jgi:hypothetical protein